MAIIKYLFTKQKRVLSGVFPENTKLRELLVAMFIGVIVFLIFNINLRSITAADTYAARYLPFSILKNHTLLLDPIVDTVAQGRQPLATDNRSGKAFWILHGRGEHFVSKYPIVLPFVTAPLYYPAIAYLDAKGWDPHLFDMVARVMEKLCASLIAASSTGLLYMLLRRRSSTSIAALLSIVYATGTTTWVISSQALWMHGLAQLLVVTTMLLVTGIRTIPRVALAGFMCALIAANRQPDTILAAALGFYGLWWAGRRLFPLFIASGLLPIVLSVAYNLTLVGNIAGAYGLMVKPENFNNDIINGIAGLLFSPMRGLFVFSPFLLFVPCLLHIVLRDRNTRIFTIAMLTGMAMQIVGYAFVDWRQGISWGPRWLTDMLPILVWMLPPVVTALSRLGRCVFAVTCSLAIIIQAIGAFWYTGAIDTEVLAMNGPDRMLPMWQIRNAPFLAELNHKSAPHDLLLTLQGNIDLIEITNVVIDGGNQNERTERHLDIAGWALVNERSPAGILVQIDDHAMGETNVFFARPDVVKTLGIESAAGWRFSLPAGQLSPGMHIATIMVGGDSGGDERLLLSRSFIVPLDDAVERQRRMLEGAARLATQRLSTDQQPLGYWLTSYTKEAGFENPKLEMNTYLNAIMLDILGLVAQSTPLQPMLTRTRSFLVNQIEMDGLVRYHGLPNAPTIGALGCAITPDTDDTALVWRVAPSENRAQLTSAMQTLHQYRRPDGLYRTWLAEQSRFTCIDPGKDPNPADIGIQMHVLMLLSQEDPKAAEALCKALIQHTDDASIWVYYASAPLVVLWRQADLSRIGCPLHLPVLRLQSSIPGQDIWNEFVLSIQNIDKQTVTLEMYQNNLQLLQKIAAQEFALMAVSPPLIYHNDFTGQVQRYYWSEDFGFALWLRLYDANRRLASHFGYGGTEIAPEYKKDLFSN